MSVFDLLRRRYSIDYESTGLSQNTTIAHFWMNIIGLKQVYRIYYWKEIWLLNSNKLMKPHDHILSVELIYMLLFR